MATMNISGVIRGEVKHKPGSFTNFSIPMSIGYGESKRTQWIKLVAFKGYADIVNKMVSTGKSVMVTAKDVEITEYNGKHSLQGVIMNIEYNQSSSESKESTAVEVDAKDEMPF